MELKENRLNGKKKTLTSYRDTSAFDASTNVSIQGTTFNVGGSAPVHFIFGSHINQPMNKHALDPEIKNLSRSHNAEYDMVTSTTRGPCTPGTRVRVLERVVEWCNSTDKSIYWMSGMAGTGKTTITYSLSHLLSSANLLGASFFCSSSLPDCRDISIIIPTIAFQLAQKYSPYAEELARVLSKDPDVLRRELNTQFRKLIIEPWELREDSLPSHIVVVIDALDECEDHHAKFLGTLFDLIPVLPFKVFLTSRPEPSVRDAMKSKDPAILSTSVLHEIERDLVQADIASFLRSHLKNHATDIEINYLAGLCGALFIFAATLVRFLTIRNANVSARIKQLKKTISEESNRTMITLDELYRGVLSAALHADLMESEAEEIKAMLFTAVCAREPLTRDGLGGLWQTTAEEVDRRLDPLRSILYIPESFSEAITVFHTSFSDFLLDPLRSGQFCCRPPVVDGLLSRRCLKVMDHELRPNLCKIINRTPNKDINSNVIQARINPSLRYAVTYFVDHWVLCGYYERETTLRLVQRFLSVYLLCWIECLSLLGKLAASVQGLEMMLRELDEDTELATLTYESILMVQYFYDLIEDTAVDIYYAFTWIPTHFRLRSLHARSYSNMPRVLSGYIAPWTGPERVINTQSDHIFSLAISEDGNQIVIGSRDKTIRVWNTLHQVEECTLEGHTDLINSVAMYGEGNCIVSAADDNTIRLWNRTTRQAVFTLEVSSGVLAVAISSDEKWIASGHRDGLVLVWCAADGSPAHTLEGHAGWVRSVSFIPNTTSLVSASNDKTARIWNIPTGETECILRGHTRLINSVACSPNGEKIITGSFDRSSRIWDTSGKELQILEAHTSSVRCVAFLPDGRRVVTGSDDGTLRIWDAILGNTVHTFTEAGEVSSIVVFPDGQRIASSSGSEVHIWSIRGRGLIGGAEARRRQSRSNGPHPVVEASAMAFSSDGRRVLLLPSLRILDTVTLEEKTTIDSMGIAFNIGALSASGSRVAAAVLDEIKVWEITGDRVVGNPVTLKYSSAAIDVRYGSFLPHIHSILFSPNERELISASDDSTARVWDVVTGKQIHSLDHIDCPSYWVWYASFSHDNTRIVSSTTHTIHIWDGQSAQQLCELDVFAHFVAFTPDDRHIIASYEDFILILNSQTGEIEYEYEGYQHWTTLDDGSSYAIHDDGWVCHFPSFEGIPHRVVWIPLPYRPSLDYDNLSGPVFTASSRGIQCCLPRKDGLITLLIPHGHEYSQS